MNSYLENIKKLLADSVLPDSEKQLLLKAVTDADKQWAITDFKLDRTEKVKKTTAILLEETIAELEKKRKAVEATNKELEIESALERVRTVAMSMNKAEDMLLVCRMISEQLELLKVKEIRNVQTAIIYEEAGTYINYEYYTKHDKTFITDVNFSLHPAQFEFVQTMLKGPEEFFSKLFGGHEVQDWYAYQKTTEQFADPLLESATSLNYYWYSMGPVALGLSTYSPLNEEGVVLFKRFRNVFEMAYRRFKDIEKAVAQAREAQIETSLERIRAQAMAMRTHEDLTGISEVLYAELRTLGFTDIRNALINIHDDENETFVNYDYSDELGKSINHLTYGIHPLIEKQIKQIRSAEGFSETSYTGKDLEDMITFRKKIGEKDDPRIENTDALYYYFYSIGTGSIGISTFSIVDGKKLAVLKRFRNVFTLAYQRYTDIALAEEQAKEAQVELALERVRARTMAMQHSEELQDTSLVLFQQLKALGEPAEQCTIGIVKESEGIIEISATLHGNIMQQTFRHNIDEPFVMSKIFRGWKDQQRTLIVELKEEELHQYNQYRNELVGKETFPVKLLPGDRRIIHVAYFSKGMLALSTNEPRPAESLQLLQRFAIVFEQTYTRFLDLQKAEAQAREAKIETALEKVRSHSMGMQKSDELKAVIQVVYDQFIHLNIKIEHTGFVIDYKARHDYDVWIADPLGVPSRVIIPYFDCIYYNRFNEAKEKGENFFATNLAFEEKNRFYQKLFEYVPGLTEEAKEFYFNCPGLAASTVLLENIALYIENFSGLPFTDEENNILLRFGKVFQQTYTRFLDLHKAEAQAREAQINLAVERVRARALAMYRSEEILDLVFKLKEEIMNLDIPNVAAATIHLKENDGNYTMWDLTAMEAAEGKLHQPMVIHYRLAEIDPELFIKRIWDNTAPYFVVEQDKEDFKRTIQFLRDHGKTKEAGETEAFLILADTKHAYHPTIPLHNGRMCIDLLEPPSDEIEMILTKMGAAFDLAYKRFEDLKNSEQQLRESKIEAALERVRSRTLAMQKSEELAETAAVLFQQLILLGIEPNRLYITIVKNDAGDAEFWITDEDGSKVSSAFETNLNDNPTFKKMLEGRKEGKKSLVIDMQGNDLQEYFEYLSSIHVPFKGGLKQKRRVQDIAYFSNGFIGMASPDEQPASTLLLLERFAYTFNLTFTRFNDLKIAEAHSIQTEEDLIKLQAEKKRAEDALSELQVTQKQLIQSEKMASLGELTAGIAHEIQNPLNFVNNFSEVSNELIDEMMEEVTKGNFDEVRAIAEDVKQNLEKINHHGKRADGIVKGMLQHSRSSSAVKEPTDINKLADEYLRLSYHGLRAKDKSFNATLKTDFDESLRPVNIIPQDIGRVLLNLLTNAFYAVNEKKNRDHDGFEPTVYISSLKIKEGVQISVRDNGNGIPQAAVDKIFQPFFTTKPTGQGTGLGLSLSYDIVKAHGGELNVETREGEGSKFIILLPGGLTPKE